MLHITLLCVGRLKEAYWREAAAEYQKRLAPFCRLTLVELDEAPVPDRASDAQIAGALTAEGERLLEKIPPRASVIALCIEGRMLDSVELSRTMERRALTGDGHIVFVIGSSWGLSPAVKQSAALRLSLSPLTFPHQLARVMLYEQIYRAFQIQLGGKYHK